MQELDAKIAGLANIEQQQIEFNNLTQQVKDLELEEKELKSIYDDSLVNPLNYWCFLQQVETGSFWEERKDSKIYKYIDLTSTKGSDCSQWNLTATKEEGYYYIKHKQTNSYVELMNGRLQLTRTTIYELAARWKLIKAGESEGYYFQNRQTSLFVTTLSDRDVVSLAVTDSSGNKSNKWKFQLTDEQVNNNIQKAYEDWQAIWKKLDGSKKELGQLKEILNASGTQKQEWEKRLQEVTAQLTTLQTEINQLNGNFLVGVKEQQTAQIMPSILTDSKGLVTKGAILGFVNSVTRLNAIETSEGNVQLSYFDNQGRMRQTNYDATADSNNATFEQWIPDAQRACLNFSNSNSFIQLNKPLYLPDDWSIEAWFVYPLAKTTEWNPLIRGQDIDTHILVKNRKQLGIYLSNDSLKQNFYDSGFNMELLTEGWHHVAAVGRGDTTLFYIDGEKVGDVKAKALKDAEENLNKKPNDAAAKKKVEDLKKARLKSNSDVAFIGNRKDGMAPFGKVAEVRIWGMALSDEEIEVNSKTLLSGNEPGLLAYYPMSEATGADVRDHSGNSNNATVSGANWWGCTAPIGNPGHTVMKFDGVNDYITTSNSLMNNLSTFTLEGWVKALSLPEAATISLFGQNDVIEFGISSQKLVVWTKDCDNWCHADAPYPLQAWHHVAVVGNGKNVLLYLDGVQIKTGGFSDPKLWNLFRSLSNWCRSLVWR